MLFTSANQSSLVYEVSVIDTQSIYIRSFEQNLNTAIQSSHNVYMNRTRGQINRVGRRRMNYGNLMNQSINLYQQPHYENGSDYRYW